MYRVFKTGNPCCWSCIGRAPIGLGAWNK